RKEFIENLGNANAQIKPLLESILSEDALKQMSEPTFAVAPGKAVKAGDSWNRTTVLDMGPIGSYAPSHRYTAQGKDKNPKQAKVTVEAKLAYRPPLPGAGGNLPFAIKKAELRNDTGSGVVVFDVEKGRMISSSLSLKLEGRMTIEIAGQETELEM